MGFYIDMIDVGQGDAFMLTLGSNEGDAIVLGDGGPQSEGQKIANFVTQYANGHVDLVIATHLDIDHIGGLRDVLNQCTVGRVFLNVPGQSTQSLKKSLRRRLLEGYAVSANRQLLEKSLQAATDLVAALEAKHLVPEQILVGKSWTHGDVALTVLNPTPERLAAAWADLAVEEDERVSLGKALVRAKAPDTSPENNSSVVLEVSHNGQPYALMAGDAGADVLKEVTSGHKYEFLKVSHHGSKTGLDEQLAAQLSVSTAYIPVGDNAYGHPAIEVLELLRRYGAKTYCTQRTRHCRRDCPTEGFGNLCHKVERDSRPNWTTVDPSKCANNR